MLTEKRFREKVVSFVIDPVIREFWVNEFAQYDAKFRTEAVSPILNKVGQFLSTATIRNIVGQPHSRINIREIMDSQKILLINLSRGKIGEDNSALLGAMMITKIQLSAMSRADVTVDLRPDSYLYVDEFQNFATESFAVILSEARKYNLNLTIANQYITQMPEIVRDAVFGNAGTIIAFRVGGTDADYLVKEFEPVFEANDLVNLDRYQIYTKLLIDGITKPAFSARTLPPVAQMSGNRDRIVELSRRNYAADRAEVEAMIVEKSKELEDELKAESEAFHAERSGASSNSNFARKSYSAPASAQYSPSHAGSSTTASVSTTNTSGSADSSSPGESVANSSAKPFERQGAVEDKPEKELRPRFLKWQNIIGNKVYKEQTARGGVKWYVGQEINPEMFEEQGISIDEQGKKMIDISGKVYGAKIETGTQKKEEKTKDEDKSPRNESGRRVGEKSEPKSKDSAENAASEADGLIDSIDVLDKNLGIMHEGEIVKF